MSLKRLDSKAVLKVMLLIAFVVTAVAVVRWTPLKSFLTADSLGRFLEALGLWAPMAFAVIYAMGVCLFVPGTVLGAVGAVIFGPYLGFACVWAGALAGASAAFFIGRYLGRDFAAALIGQRLQPYDDAIGRNGFATVLYMRLLYFPFTPMNFGMGLTKVRFRDYLAGTGIGILVGTFILTFFVGTVRDVWSGGDWAELLSWKVFFSVALFIFSFFIPKLVKAAKPSSAAEPG